MAGISAAGRSPTRAARPCPNNATDHYMSIKMETSFIPPATTERIRERVMAERGIRSALNYVKIKRRESIKVANCSGKEIRLHRQQAVFWGHLTEAQDYFIEGSIAHQMAKADNYCIHGNGVNCPMGFLSYQSKGMLPRGGACLEFVISDEPPVLKPPRLCGYRGTMPSGLGVLSVSLIRSLVEALPDKHRKSAVFIMCAETSRIVRRLKDSEGSSIWTGGATKVEPGHLLGYPVLISEGMPQAVRGAYPVAFGDFVAGYTLVESVEMHVHESARECRLIGRVKNRAVRFAGGDVTDFSAIKLIKISGEAH